MKRNGEAAKKTREDDWQEGREAGDEGESEKGRETSRKRAKEGGREERKRERAKSVNFLTFYEPSEFHNLEPVRVVLCTRKVSARPVLPLTLLFSSLSRPPRSFFAALSRKGKDAPSRKRMEKLSVCNGITAQQR